MVFVFFYLILFGQQLYDKWFPVFISGQVRNYHNIPRLMFPFCSVWLNMAHVSSLLLLSVDGVPFLLFLLILLRISKMFHAVKTSVSSNIPYLMLQSVISQFNIYSMLYVFFV